MTAGREADATTIQSRAGRLRAAGLSFIVINGVMLLLIDGLDRAAWKKHALAAVVAAYLAATVSVGIWRISRLAVQGITVRAFLRTRRLCWPEVSAFADGATWMGEDRRLALRIVLNDGRSVIAGATLRVQMRDKEDPLPAVLATIEQVPARHQVSVQLSGRPPALAEVQERSTGS